MKCIYTLSGAFRKFWRDKPCFIQRKKSLGRKTGKKRKKRRKRIGRKWVRKRERRARKARREKIKQANLSSLISILFFKKKDARALNGCPKGYVQARSLTVSLPLPYLHFKPVHINWVESIRARMIRFVEVKHLAKCPKCGMEVSNPRKTWKMAGRPDKSGKRTELTIGLFDCCRSFRAVLAKRKI